MADFGVIAYQAAYAALPSARVKIRTAGSEKPVDALCASVGQARTTGDFGIGADPGVLVRMLTANVPAEGMELGNAFTLIAADGSEYQMRVQEWHESGGVSRFIAGAIHGG
jgi:hypothetical protein